MNRGPNIFDFLTERNICHHVSAPEKPEPDNLAALIKDIEAETIDFAFLYWAGLDGLLHMVGNQSPQVPAKLRVYEQWIDQLLAAARRHYGEVRLYIFSDHGMANCDRLLDLKAKIEPLDVEMEKDYVVVYDSTMARFWFFNDRARQLVTETLQQVPQGRILPDGGVGGDARPVHRPLFRGADFSGQGRGCSSCPATWASGPSRACTVIIRPTRTAMRRC